MANLPLYKRLFVVDPREASDADLIALLLSGATGNVDPELVARRLLSEANHDLGLIDNVGIAQEAGVEGAAYARLMAAGELYRRMMARSQKMASVITSAADAVDHVRALGLEDYENLAVLYLDSRHRVLGRRVLTRGNLRHTIVDPRQVFRPGLALGASAIIMLHNHPSGATDPSSADVDVTQRCVQSGRVIGIEVLDHVVVSRSGFSSLRELGMMPNRTVTPTGFV
jgi:DNA repair protein RadC